MKYDFDLGPNPNPSAVRDALLDRYRERVENETNRPWERTEPVLGQGAAYARCYERKAVVAQEQLAAIQKISGKLFHALKVVRSTGQLRSVSGPNIRIDLHPGVFEGDLVDSDVSSYSSD